MRPGQGLDWIGGSWRPAASQLEFEPDPPVPAQGPRGRWARSGQRELAEALEAGARAEAGWRRSGRHERVRVLLAAVDALERDEALVGELAVGLGIEPGLARERLAADLLGAREGLEILRDAQGESAGPGLFAAHWSDLVGPLVRRLAQPLSAGSSAVVLSDPRLPEAPQALARALEAAGLPPGVVALLHDDGSTVLRAALRQPAAAWIRARGPRAELEELAAELGQRAFGAGLTAVSLWPLASAVHVVGERDDPLAEAARVMERWLDPSATLCGQLPDAVGRVLCHQRRLSAFTEALLARLDASAADTACVAAVEPDLGGWMAEAWSLGLDEGACPIFGEAPGEDRGRARRALRAVAFTNVETGGRLLRLERPAPLLRLARVARDEEAHGLRAELARAAGPIRLE